MPRSSLRLSHVALACGALASSGSAACLSDATVVPADAGTKTDAGSSPPRADAHSGGDAGSGLDATMPGLDSTMLGHDAAAPDSGLPPDALADVPIPLIDAYIRGDGGPSRCAISPTVVTCTEQQLTITTPAGSDPEAGTTYPSYARLVYYQVPLGTAPAAGWPVVFMFQGSFLSAQYTFTAASNEDFGMYYQAELVKVLLDSGYAVLAPEALDSGETYWQTNISPYAASWSGAPDDVLIQSMLTGIAGGMFGPLDATTLFATGISSGGYMSSRMAVSYEGKFKALAIESGAYATCLSGESAITGGACTVPTLSSTHPPTLFLHGDEDTTIVPEWTVQAYEAALKAAGVTYNEIDDANSGHQWIPEAPAAVLAWFNTYR